MTNIFYSGKCFRTTFRKFSSIFVPRNGIQRCFLSAKCLGKKNMGSLLLVLFRGSDLRAVFSSADCSRTKFRKFSLLLFLFNGTEFEHFSLPRNGSEQNSKFSVPRNSRNSVGYNHLFRVFRLPRNNFLLLWEIANNQLARSSIDP